MAIAIVKKKIKCFLLHPNRSELFMCYLLKEHYTFQLCPVIYLLLMTHDGAQHKYCTDTSTCTPQ